jgi:hypothetical protein
MGPGSGAGTTAENVQGLRIFTRAPHRRGVMRRKPHSMIGTCPAALRGAVPFQEAGGGATSAVAATPMLRKVDEQGSW